MIIPYFNLWEWPDYCPKLQYHSQAWQFGSAPVPDFSLCLVYCTLTLVSQDVEELHSKEGARSLIKGLQASSSQCDHIFNLSTTTGFNDRVPSWTQRAAYIRCRISSLQNCNKCLLFINHPDGRNPSNKDVYIRCFCSHNQHGSSFTKPLWELKGTVPAAIRNYNLPLTGCF